MLRLALALAAPPDTDPCDPALPDDAPVETHRSMMLACLSAARIDDAGTLADRLLDRLGAHPSPPDVLAIARVRLGQAADPCATGYGRNEVVTLLLDHPSKELRQLLTSDAAFAPLNRVGRYRKLVEPDDRWLMGTSWILPNPAQALPLGQLDLEAGGVGKRSRRLDPFDDAMQTEPITWTVEKGQVTLQAGDEVETLPIRDAGAHLGPYQDLPDDCG